MAEVLAARHSLGALPLIVLSTGQAAPGPAAPAVARKQDADLLHLSTNSKGVRVATTGPGGGVPRDRPGAVIGAVRQVLDGARRHQRLAR